MINLASPKLIFDVYFRKISLKRMTLMVRSQACHESTMKVHYMLVYHLRLSPDITWPKAYDNGIDSVQAMFF